MRDLVAHIEDSIRSGEMSEAPKILPKQTVIMKSGKELTRMIFDTNGTDWGYQTGRIWQNGVKVPVYRDKQETLVWHEDSELPDIDEPASTATLTTPEQDERIGRRAVTNDGKTDGVIESITRLPDGYETISIAYGDEGMQHGGLPLENVTILEMPESASDDCSSCHKPIDRLYTHTENGVKQRYCSYCYMAQFD